MKKTALLLCVFSSRVAFGALSGQIIVDPETPRWLVYNRDSDGDGKLDPHFMCGPGDPEGFLYRGTRNADGTRSGDQMTLINKLKANGGNCIYMQAVRSHGGDGGSDHNPFIGSDPSNGLDQDILDQWETWFTEMDDNGIVIYFFFYDDSARIWSGDSVGSAERSFIRGLVDEFEHHKNLIWCVAEEYQERYSAARVSNIAAEIRAADDNDHVIAVHKLSGLSFSEFADDPSIDQFAIQYNQSSASALHDGMVTAWNGAAGKYNLNMSEAASYGTGATARKKNWACAMGGAYVMILGMDIAGTAVSDLQDCGRLVSFIESTNFNQMAPHDELAYGGTQYVLALPGDSYIAYASSLSGNIGLKNLTSGTYAFKWFDCTNGATVTQTGVNVAAGSQSWSRPPGIGSELAVWVRRTGGTGHNVPPTANDQSVSVEEDGSVQITLSFSDPDGPGPCTFEIASPPSHGTLSGSGQTRSYAPAAAYVGGDSFSWRVSDGADWSNAATCSITVTASVNQAPVADDKAVTTEEETEVYIQLTYTDPDGPGPYTITIVDGPDHGTLAGKDNDRYYTPDAGCAGPDSISWKVNDGQDDSNIATVSVSVTLAAPSSLSAAAVSESQIDLSWAENSNSETGYKLERTDGSAGSLTVTLKAYNGTNTPPTVEEAGTVKCFKVGSPQVNDRSETWTSVPPSLDGATRLLCARDDKADSGYNSMYVVTLSAPAAVYAVVSPEYHPNPMPFMDATWTDTGTTADATNKSNYRVWKKDAPAGELALGADDATNKQGACYVFIGGASWTEIATVGANATSYSDKGLSPETTYTYRVRATNASGDSDYSNEASATTQAGGTPNQEPVADAGVDQSVTDTDGDGEETVTLDGSGSYDKDGTITSYSWAEDGAEIASGVTAQVALTVGTHVVTLTVTDDDGAAGGDTVTVVVDASGDDADGDEIPDAWEEEHFGSIDLCEPEEDSDDDGLTNRQEYEAGTDPQESDTDGDGYPDGEDPDPVNPPGAFHGVGGGCSSGAPSAVGLGVLFAFCALRKKTRTGLCVTRTARRRGRAPRSPQAPGL